MADRLVGSKLQHTFYKYFDLFSVRRGPCHKHSPKDTQAGASSDCTVLCGFSSVAMNNHIRLYSRFIMFAFRLSVRQQGRILAQYADGSSRFLRLHRRNQKCRRPVSKQMIIALQRLGRICGRGKDVWSTLQDIIYGREMERNKGMENVRVRL